MKLDQERDGAHLRASSGDFTLHEWAVLAGGDTNDLQVVKLANPSSFVTVESLRERRDSPSMREADWLRFACGQWVSAERSWLADGAWEACRDDAAEIPAGERVFLGVDIGRKQDSSAIVACYPADGRVTARAWVFDSPGGEESQDLAVIEGKIRELAKAYKITEVAFDPWSFTRSAQPAGEPSPLPRGR